MIFGARTENTSEILTLLALCEVMRPRVAWSTNRCNAGSDSNIITRAVGFNAKPNADFWMLPARTGLRLLLCSDGLTKEVSDDRIRLHMAAGLNPVETAGALIDAALASGGRDNVTAIVVDVLDAPEILDLEDTAPRPPRH